jgi:hypothetical protein
VRGNDLLFDAVQHQVILERIFHSPLGQVSIHSHRSLACGTLISARCNATASGTLAATAMMLRRPSAAGMRVIAPCLGSSCLPAPTRSQRISCPVPPSSRSVSTPRPSGAVSPAAAPHAAGRTHRGSLLARASSSNGAGALTPVQQPAHEPMAAGEERHVLSVFVRDEAGLINQVSDVFTEAGAQLKLVTCS